MSITSRFVPSTTPVAISRSVAATSGLLSRDVTVTSSSASENPEKVRRMVSRSSGSATQRRHRDFEHLRALQDDGRVGPAHVAPDAFEPEAVARAEEVNAHVLRQTLDRQLADRAAVARGRARAAPSRS